ncbi:MAG: L-arabinose transport system permease protein AraQ [Tenericutes bacterium ADurb.Bin239]|nr:MAG: L-arabinose transport system permease protein AraQ [Tenericutes bacterium ADurb.Bin239]
MKKSSIKANRSIKRAKLFSDISTYVILILGSVLMLAPLIWMLSASLKVNQFSLYGPLFHEWKFSNYVEVFKTIPVWTGLLNSILVAVPSIVIGTFVSGLAAYAFAKIKFKFRNIIFILMLAVMMIPFPVIMIPQYYIFSDLDWIGTLLPLIIPKLFGNIMMIFFLRQFLTHIPDALVESAKIDGANHFQIFWIIILPLLKPALAAQTVLWFIGIWNDYLAPNFFSAASPTLPVVIGGLVSDFPIQEPVHLNMAASIISMIPVLAVFAIFQKQIINSFVLSGMKE